MVITDNFALTAGVVIPVILLAAITEAREFEQKTRDLRLVGDLTVSAKVAADILERARLEPEMDEEEKKRRLQAAHAAVLTPKLALKTLVGNLRAKAYLVVGLVWAVTLLVLAVSQIGILMWLATTSHKPSGLLAAMTVYGIAVAIVMQVFATVLRLSVNVPTKKDIDGLLQKAGPLLAAELEKLHPKSSESPSPSTGHSLVRDARRRVSRSVVPSRPVAGQRRVRISESRRRRPAD